MRTLREWLKKTIHISSKSQRGAWSRSAWERQQTFLVRICARGAQKIRGDARICQYVVKAGSESSAVNELSGPGDCWTVIASGFPTVTRRRSIRGTSS